MYSVTNRTTEDFCKKAGFIFEIHFVETMTKKGKIFVRGTLGKPHEFAALKHAVEKLGGPYVYKVGRR